MREDEIPPTFNATRLDYTNLQEIVEDGKLLEVSFCARNIVWYGSTYSVELHPESF